jgi:hypothetical protein
MDYLILLIALVIVAGIIVLTYFIVRVWSNSVPAASPKLATKRVIEDYDKFPVWGMEKYNQLNGSATPYNGPMPGNANLGTPKILFDFPLVPAAATEVIVFNPVIDVNNNLYFATVDGTTGNTKIYGYDVTGKFELTHFPLIVPGAEITNPLIINSDNILLYVTNQTTINAVNLSDIPGPTGYTNFPFNTGINIWKFMVSSSGRITFVDADTHMIFYFVDKSANVTPVPMLTEIFDYAVDENDDIYLATAGVFYWISDNNFKTIGYPLGGTISQASIAIGNDGNIYYAIGNPFLYGVTKQLNGSVKNFPFMGLSPLVQVNTGADKKVYAIDDANRIYAVNSDGSFAWANTMTNFNKIYPTSHGNVFYINDVGPNTEVAAYNSLGQFLNRYPATSAEVPLLANTTKINTANFDYDFVAVGKNSAIYFPLIDDIDGRTKMYAIY